VVPAGTAVPGWVVAGVPGTVAVNPPYGPVAGATVFAALPVVPFVVVTLPVVVVPVVGVATVPGVTTFPVAPAALEAGLVMARPPKS